VPREASAAFGFPPSRTRPRRPAAVPTWPVLPAPRRAPVPSPVPPEARGTGRAEVRPGPEAPHPGSLDPGPPVVRTKNVRVRLTPASRRRVPVGVAVRHPEPPVLLRVHPLAGLARPCSGSSGRWRRGGRGRYWSRRCRCGGLPARGRRRRRLPWRRSRWRRGRLRVIQDHRRRHWAVRDLAWRDDRALARSGLRRRRLPRKEAGLRGQQECNDQGGHGQPSPRNVAPRVPGESAARVRRMRVGGPVPAGTQCSAGTPRRESTTRLGRTSAHWSRLVRQQR
jgi:hypothetical protein